MNDIPVGAEIRPHGQFHLLESAGNRRVEAHDVERFMGTGSDDRYAPVVGKKFDHVQGDSLLAGAARKQVLDFVDDEVEAAWAYRHRPGLGAALLARQRDQSEDIKAMAWKAQHRLNARYAKLLAKGKAKQQVITAVGRELLGFIWAIGVAAERSLSEEPRRALKRAARA